MGSCCSGGESVSITTDKDGTIQATGYGPRHSHPANATSLHGGPRSDGVRVMSNTPASLHTGPAQAPGPPDYGLQPDLRYPGDASGVYYQPTDNPPVLLGRALADQDYPAPSSPPAAAQTTTRDSAVTMTTTPTPTTPAATITTTTITTPAVTTITITTNPTQVAAPSQPTAPDVDTVTASSALQRQLSNYQPSDVMISYSRTDGDVMQLIKGELEAAGITVWVDVSSIDAGADFLSKIGEAIIDAKFFICILSEQAVRSKYCRDEVALAYVSNTAIFPINLQPREHLLPLMDTGLKLQLAHYNWTPLTEEDNRMDNIRNLVSTMKAELDDLAGLPSTEDDPLSSLPSTGTSPPTVSPMTSSEGLKREVSSPDDVEVMLEGEAVDKGGSPVQSPASVGEPPEFKTKKRLRERNRALMTSQGDEASHVMPEQFWSDQFGVVDYVPWDRFTGAFQEVFKGPVKVMFSTEDEQHLMDILKRELEVEEDERVYKYQLLAFCSVSGDVTALWPRVYEQARESFAMREVFNMDSSVRVEAIENLGKFRSAAVIDALRDLLTDPDANVRAVATVSLSRTNANDPVTIRHILRTLNDKDRLVREAGCLALGHLKARQAISKLSHLWRNDVISHVREAAAVALRQLGGQEVEDVMRVTKVLAEEIRSLTEDTT